MLGNGASWESEGEEQPFHTHLGPIWWFQGFGKQAGSVNLSLKTGKKGSKGLDLNHLS